MKSNLRDCVACVIACVAIAVCGASLAAGLRAWGAGRAIATAAIPSAQSIVPSPGDMLVVAPGVQFSATLDATQMVAFPNCADPAGRPLAGCVVGWRICGNSGAGAASPPYCIDMYPGANSFQLEFIENISGQITEFPVGSVGLNVGPAGN
ncbi:MAG: hypothetical protein ACREQC_07100 [Candidatus Binataceae bacterium]